MKRGTSGGKKRGGKWTDGSIVGGRPKKLVLNGRKSEDDKRRIFREEEMNKRRMYGKAVKEMTKMQTRKRRRKRKRKRRRKRRRRRKNENDGEEIGRSLVIEWLKTRKRMLRR